MTTGKSMLNEVEAIAKQLDELNLIEAVLRGYPASIARSDALRAVKVLRNFILFGGTT